MLPVVHVTSAEQALRNTAVAREAGADGVFLINQAMGTGELLAVHSRVAAAHPAWWLGVTCLDLDPIEAVQEVASAPAPVAGLWTDITMVRESEEEQTASQAVLDEIVATAWPGLYFGGVTVKYQRPVDDLGAAAYIAGRYMDVVTTSGPGTGQPAKVHKIRAMKEALGELPPAIASGVTPDNVADNLPVSDCYLVATGASDSFEELNAGRVRRLVETVRAWDAGRADGHERRERPRHAETQPPGERRRPAIRAALERLPQEACRPGHQRRPAKVHPPLPASGPRCQRVRSSALRRAQPR